MFLEISPNSQENTKKRKRDSGTGVYKIYKNSFSYRIPPVAASVHVIPHSLTILSHPLATSNRVPPPPFSNRKHYGKWILKTYIRLIYPLLTNPAIVTFYKKITRWTATFEEIYFQMWKFKLCYQFVILIFC